MMEAQKGRIVSEETRQKMSESAKKRWAKRKLLKLPGFRTGIKHSEETKKKISETKTGIKRSEETKKKISESHKGKKHSDETKKKMSESQKKRWTKRKSIELDNDETRD